MTDEKVMTVKVGKAASVKGIFAAISEKMDQVTKIERCAQAFKLVAIRVKGPYAFFNYTYDDMRVR